MIARANLALALVACLAGLVAAAPGPLTLSASCTSLDSADPQVATDSAWNCFTQLTQNPFIWEVLTNKAAFEMYKYATHELHLDGYDEAYKMSHGDSLKGALVRTIQPTMLSNRANISQFCVPFIQTGGGKYVDYLEQAAAKLDNPLKASNFLQNDRNARVLATLKEFCTFANKFFATA